MLETIQIHEQNSEPAPLAASGFDSLAQPVVQQHAVGQVGDPIVMRQTV